VLKRSLYLVLILFLAACSAGPAPTDAPTAPPVATVGPTPTAAPPLTILVVPSDMKVEQSQEYQTAVYEMAQANGFRFMVLNQLIESDLEPALKIVITMVAQDDLPALAAKASQAQFLAINLPGITAGGNISVLGDGDTSIDKIAFIAGVIAASITEDYHTGALIKKDDPDGTVVMDSFKAGQQYFCGLCNHVVDAFTFYPQIQDIPADAKPNEYGAYADILIRSRVETIFIQPGLEIPELIEALKGSSAMMIGTQTPAGNVPGWVVTIKPDYLEAMKLTFPDLIAGNGGKTYQSPLSFKDANPNLFGEGKQAYVRGVLNNVLSGALSTTIK
jgi:hypothetical protein